MTAPAPFTDISIDELRKEGVDDVRVMGMLRKMLQIRRFEEKVEELYLVKGQLMGPSHLYIGQEAVAVGILSASASNDLVISNYRGHGHAIARDVPMKYLMAELYGRADGTCKGLGGSMHSAIHPAKGMIFASAIVASGVPIAVGLALASKQKKKDDVVIVFFGDGGLNTGAFHEGANLAGIWNLPVIFVCENNQYAMGTSTAATTASANLVDRGAVYNMPSKKIDGNDVGSVFVAAKDAIARARKGDGPSFLLCQTYRSKGHGVYDRSEYKPVGEADQWIDRDPILRLRKVIMENRIATDADISAMEGDIAADIGKAVEFAQKSPDLDFRELSKYVYA